MPSCLLLDCWCTSLACQILPSVSLCQCAECVNQHVICSIISKVHITNTCLRWTRHDASRRELAADAEFSGSD